MRRKIIIKNNKVLRTLRDENCPVCGFPETVRISRLSDMEVIGFECKKCKWRKCLSFKYSWRD